ncbi:MAG: hypothetical protein QM296_00540 [Bacillota bacterium]|nr:hypothetical protein [Bacillota bacterium]
MARLKGVTITLIVHEPTGSVDGFGAPICADVETPIENVLIAPVSSEDIVHQLELTGKRAVYSLAIPKSDEHDWTDAEVRFFGQRWRVIGTPLEGIEPLIPLDWNRKVMVERYE